MKKYLVGVITSGGNVRPCTVEMPDNYNPGADSPDVADSFPALRKAIEKKMEKRLDAQIFRSDMTTVISISELDARATTLDQRIESVLKEIGSDALVSNVLCYLPENAILLDDDSFRNAVTAAISVV